MSEARPRQAEIIDPAARVELLFNGGCVLTEGVAAAPDGSILFSDITSTDSCADERGIQAGHIWRFVPGTGDCTIYRSPSGMANGIAFDSKGRMVVAEGADGGGRRVTRTDMETGRSYVIASHFDGLPLNSPNDVTIDRADRVYFTDPRYVGREPLSQPVMGVYRIDVDGRVDRVVTDMRKPNGVAIAPAGNRLYVSESDNGVSNGRGLPPDAPRPDGAWWIYFYPLDADGAVGARTVFADLARIGQPDGMTVDAAGNLYVALARPRPGVCVFSPAADWLAFIGLAVPVTNVEFGRGAASRLLYITAGRGLYRTELRTEGFHHTFAS